LSIISCLHDGGVRAEDLQQHRGELLQQPPLDLDVEIAPPDRARARW
jgi:hypothetical protein